MNIDQLIKKIELSFESLLGLSIHGLLGIIVGLIIFSLLLFLIIFFNIIKLSAVEPGECKGDAGSCERPKEWTEYNCPDEKCGSDSSKPFYTCMKCE